MNTCTNLYLFILLIRLWHARKPIYAWYKSLKNKSHVFTDKVNDKKVNFSEIGLLTTCCSQSVSEKINYNWLD